MPDPQVLLTAFFALTLLVVVLMLVVRWIDEGSDQGKCYKPDEHDSRCRCRQGMHVLERSAEKQS